MEAFSEIVQEACESKPNPELKKSADELLTPYHPNLDEYITQLNEVITRYEPEISSLNDADRALLKKLEFERDKIQGVKDFFGM